MSWRNWHSPHDGSQQGRDATLAQVIEAIDRRAPRTKARVAEEVGISEEYLSDLLQELKADDIVRKAYVIDDAAVYESAGSVSLLTDTSTDGDTPTPEAENGQQAVGNRGRTVLELLARLDEVTATQYAAARAEFVGETPEEPADALESVTNERYSAVVGELKSYTLTTDWPGNRVASDLSTIATNFEIVGDRACFISDVVEQQDAEGPGVVEERVLDIFDAGQQINELLGQILFESDLTTFEELQAREEAVHRELDELFELVTAYSPEMYGYLVSVTRALERAIYYWVDAAEIAVRLHSGVRPEHIRV